MRKHLYLITEHEDDERVGLVAFSDSRKERATKNAESPIHKLDDDAEGWVVVGKEVHLGYYDFDSEDDYEDHAVDVMEQKLGEIDAEWLEKAGHDPSEFTDGVSA